MYRWRDVQGLSPSWRVWRRSLAAAGLVGAVVATACVAPPPPPDPAVSLAQLALPTPPSVALLPLGRPAELQAPTPAPIVAPPIPSTPIPSVARRQAGETLLAALKADLAASWVKNHREVDLRGGPSEAAPVFTALPQWTLLKRLEQRNEWTLVYYEGDGAGRQPGPGWVRTADIGAVGLPPLWLASNGNVPLWSGDQASDRKLMDLPAGARLELLAGASPLGRRIKVRLPGDGRQVPPGEGWVEADDASRVRTPTPPQLPWAYPRAASAEVRLRVPYRTQMDGSPYAGANCGPSVLGMALETFGIDVSPRDLRTQVLLAQDGEPWEDDSGSFIWALADVAQRYKLKTYGLYETDGTTLRRWSADDVRGEVRRGHPVILQVRYRGLPRRGDSDYYGDHYIVVTGLLGAGFLYNDSIWGPSENEGPGFDRLMSEAELLRAMNTSDRPFAYSGFALSR